MNYISETLSDQKMNIENSKNIKSSEPFIPFKQTLFKIPQNLPEGTSYSINIDNDNTKQSIGEKIDILNSTLNIRIETLSFLILRQLPELSKTIQEKINTIQILLNKKTEELETLEQSQINIVEQLSNIINTQEQDKDITITKIKETLLKKSTLKIVPPIRIT